MFLPLLPLHVAPFALVPLARLILAGLLGSGGRRRFVEEEVALFEQFVRVGRGLASRGRRGRAGAAAAGAGGGGDGDGDSAATATVLHRTDAPRAAAAAAASLDGLLEFLPAAASHSEPVPVDFPGLDAPLLDSDLLGRRRVEFSGAVRTAVRGGGGRRRSRRRRGRFAVGGFGGGQRRGESRGEPSGAQRGGHLIDSRSPTAASAALFHATYRGRRAGGRASERAGEQREGRGGAGPADLIDTRGKDEWAGFKLD